jgi:predicted RNA-binding protein YlxR (DUF448 family)
MKKPQKEMIRIVGGPEGVATFDLSGRLPGRGAYVCPALPCLTSLKATSLQHVLKKKITLAPPGELGESLRSSLERQFTGLLSIGRKAGKLEYGADAVTGALAAGRGSLLLTAGDAAARTRSRIERLGSKVSSRIVSDRETLGRIFGRSAVSVVLVTSAGIARRLELMADRLTALNTGSYHDLN